MTLHTLPENIGPVVSLTFEEAEALLRRALGAKGADYVYEQVYMPLYEEKGCVYFTDDGCPSCKIGHVLHYKGVTREDLEETGSNSGTDVGNLVADGLLVIDLRTEALLSLVQEHQDQGMPWGEALEQALAGVDEWVENREREEPETEAYWGGPF